ncbi:MAG: Gfo/Idh/MocA family oxidoreductase [Saprospiraceae bacterium]|nr:Gfo/Idh/MocA family oxidoreductase [Saprospiraceae bacterium]
MASRLKIACIGAGYFARFHVEAWQRIEEVELIAICDLNKEKADQLAQTYHVPNTYTDIDQLLNQENIDVLDIITQPETHLDLCLKAAERGIHIICQKPLAPTFEMAKEIVEKINQYDIRFMVHENWRWQPWYRKIKTLLDSNAIGEKLHSIYFRMRMGDGWGEDAYLHRQPYFRSMPRLLIYETGIHFIDTFRFLAGEVDSVFANLKKLNPVITGEDSGQVIFNFNSGANAIWDANRFNESKSANARYTFGEMLIDGNGGSIRLYNDGRVTIQRLGEVETEIEYTHNDVNFAGDCVYNLQKHFIDCYIKKLPFESSGVAYLKNLEIQEAIYQSANEQKVIQINQ